MVGVKSKLADLINGWALVPNNNPENNDKKIKAVLSKYDIIKPHIDAIITHKLVFTVTVGTEIIFNEQMEFIWESSWQERYQTMKFEERITNTLIIKGLFKL